jgi:hypothetical protein
MQRTRGCHGGPTLMAGAISHTLTSVFTARANPLGILSVLLVSLLAISQADARGGGGFGAGGHSSFAGRAHVGTVVVRSSRGVIVRRSGFVRGEPVAHFAYGLGPHRFANGFQSSLAQDWGRWGWPIGDWWWPGNFYQPVQQTEEALTQPQIVYINADREGRMQTADAAPDVSYVKGCHPIPSGYHCDLPNEGN